MRRGYVLTKAVSYCVVHLTTYTVETVQLVKRWMSAKTHYNPLTGIEIQLIWQYAAVSDGIPDNYRQGTGIDITMLPG